MKQNFAGSHYTPCYGNLFKKVEQVTQQGHHLLKTVEASDIVLS